MILSPCFASPSLANTESLHAPDWPNFLEGMNYTAHAWKQSACVNKDRVDGVDGWNSPVINWTQHAFHPHLVFDVASYEASPRFVAGWPRNASTASAGATVTRELIIFNDSLMKPGSMRSRAGARVTARCATAHRRCRAAPR